MASQASLVSPTSDAETSRARRVRLTASSSVMSGSRGLMKNAVWPYHIRVLK